MKSVVNLGFIRYFKMALCGTYNDLHILTLPQLNHVGSDLVGNIDDHIAARL